MEPSQLQNTAFDAIVVAPDVFTQLISAPKIVGLRPVLILGDLSDAQMLAALRWGVLDCVALADEKRFVARIVGLQAAHNDRVLFANALSYLEESVLIAGDCVGGRCNVIFRNATCERRANIRESDSFVLLNPGPRTDLRKVKEIHHEIQAGHPVRAELVDYGAAGEVLWTELSAAPLTDDGYWIVVMRDVTRRHEAEDNVQRLRELVIKSQKYENVAVLAAGIAHDCNNILTAIVGSAEFARMSCPPEHAAQADLHTIIQASQRVANLIRELLDFAGPGKGICEPVYLNVMVTTMLTILRSQVHRSIIVRKALHPEVPPVEANPGEIEQVMLNLCLNASEAMAVTGGTLSITTDVLEVTTSSRTKYTYGAPKPGIYAVFEVTDSGVGMEPALVDRIFDPFFTTKEGASGVGLSVALSIIKAYHGAIMIESHPGRGTTVRVILPSAPARERRMVEVGVEPKQGQQRTLLLVDDEEMLRTLCQRALEPLGYHVLVAPDGVEGIRIFRENMSTIDLVILDLSMPRKGGEDTFQEMQDLCKEIPVLLCCGYDEASAQQKINGSAFAGYLPKPFGIATLINSVQETISRAKPRQS
ncbi:MAG: hybrid sensor histidine kinase/response regulator [Acidiferrobacter sp.]